MQFEIKCVQVPGYGTIVGTEEQSEVGNRPFFAFRSVFYAEQPTADNRFLVRMSNNACDKYYLMSTQHNNELLNLCIIIYKAASSESDLSNK